LLLDFGDQVNSSRKSRDQILGVISRKDAERLLLDLANLQESDVRRLMTHNRKILAPLIADEKGANEYRLFTLRNHLRKAWNEPDRRTREWHIFQLRRKFNEWSLKVSGIPINPFDFQKIMGFDDPDRKDHLGQAIDPFEQPPPLTPVEAAMFYLQTAIGDRAKHCANPTCSIPYFLGTKKGQKYHDDICAQHGQREAKRKWWNENRAKTGGLG